MTPYFGCCNINYIQQYLFLVCDTLFDLVKLSLCYFAFYMSLSVSLRFVYNMACFVYDHPCISRSLFFALSFTVINQLHVSATLCVISFPDLNLWICTDLYLFVIAVIGCVTFECELNGRDSLHVIVCTASERFSSNLETLCDPHFNFNSSILSHPFYATTGSRRPQTISKKDHLSANYIEICWN